MLSHEDYMIAINLVVRMENEAVKALMNNSIYAEARKVMKNYTTKVLNP